jgi:hypothetical protein
VQPDPQIPAHRVEPSEGADHVGSVLQAIVVAGQDVAEGGVAGLLLDVTAGAGDARFDGTTGTGREEDQERETFHRRAG